MTHINDLPDGSEAINIQSNYGIEIYTELLNGLANGSLSGEVVYNNLAVMDYADVTINLGPISTDGVNSKIFIQSGDSSYEQIIPSGFSAKMIFFKRIPSVFLSNFKIKNDSGVDFFHAENMLTIRPIFE